MSLYAKFASLAETYRGLAQSGHNPFKVAIDRVLSPTEAIIDNRPTLMVGTNNYLGLTFDPECVEAAVAALHEEGTGTTGSRIAKARAPPTARTRPIGSSRTRWPRSSAGGTAWCSRPATRPTSA